MAEVIENHKEETHASGIAKAGLTTGIIGTSLGAIAAMSGSNGLLGGLLGGGNNRQQEKIEALRDENLLLKSGKHTDDAVNAINIRLAVLDERQSAMRTEFGQALQLEATQRANGDAMLRQYTDDNFLKADKVLDAKRITPAVALWPFNTPSFASYVAPVPGFPVPGMFPPPPFPPVQSGTGTTDPGTATSTGSNG